VNNHLLKKATTIATYWWWRWWWWPRSTATVSVTLNGHCVNIHANKLYSRLENISVLILELLSYSCIIPW